METARAETVTNLDCHDPITVPCHHSELYLMVEAIECHQSALK